MPRKISILIFILCALTQTASLQQPKPAAGDAGKKDGGSSAREALTPIEPESSLSPQQFAQLIDKISEPNGYFDTDNLISNETSYLHVMGKLRKMNVSGGAYIGVGPDQNFSYIAQIRPQIVFISDIRRDNLLQHLWFKSLFALSKNRLEYLCLMFGVPVPADLKAWETKDIQELVGYLDKTPSKREQFEKTWEAVDAKLKTLGPTLSALEIDAVKRIHMQFYEAGLDLKFTSKNRSPRPYYPSYRDLLLEKDLGGKRCNYLANEEDFKFLKSLEERNLLVPVVGNLSGTGALRQIAAYLKQRRLTVSALYTSNVEFYLMRNYRDEEFNPFAENVKALPRDERSVIIRSYFNGTWGYSHPQTVAGYYSTQLLQTFDSFVKEYGTGGYESYSDIIGKHMLDLR